VAGWCVRGSGDPRSPASGCCVFPLDGQVLAELAEDKQDAGERAVFRFRAELAVPGELEKGLAELVDEDDPPRETDIY
jgi:hypothetical protein